MSAQADHSKASTGDTAPESPTTARPLEMDDDDVQETGILEPSSAVSGAGASTTGAASPGGEPAPPPKPPRPMTEQQKHQMTLKEAFPSIDESVIKAVLTASGGRIDPAFNALLEMTDPDAASREVEEPPPPFPPRPTGPAAGATPQSQLEADEQYARQLAQHYENVSAYEARTSNRGPSGGRPPRQQTGLDMNRNLRSRDGHDHEREHSFVDDDLPVIKENLRKGFAETQKTVNTWFQTLKKRIDEEFNDDDDGHRHQQQQGQQQHPHGQSPAYRAGGRQSSEAARRSGDYDRYDADPQVLSDDFAGIKLNSDGTPVRTTGPNPQIFRPPPPSTSPQSGGGEGRKVAFREGADEIGDPYNVSPRVPPKDSAAAAAGKPSKWQPLSTMEPSPIAENDPFSLGDSEDEKDAAKGHKKSGSSLGGGEIKMEDAERLRKAAEEAMNDSIVDKKSGEGPAAAASAKKD